MSAVETVSNATSQIRRLREENQRLMAKVVELEAGRTLYQANVRAELDALLGRLGEQDAQALVDAVDGLRAALEAGG